MFDCCSLEINGGLLLFAKLTIQSGGSKPIKLTAHHIVIKWVLPHHPFFIFVLIAATLGSLRQVLRRNRSKEI